MTAKNAIKKAIGGAILATLSLAFAFSLIYDPSFTAIQNLVIALIAVMLTASFVGLVALAVWLITK